MPDVCQCQPTVDESRLVARILLRAAVPLMKVLLAEDPKLAARYRGWNRRVQFEVRGDDELACHLLFSDGVLEVLPERCAAPDVSFVFTDARSLKAFFTGRLALPRIRGLFSHLGTVLKLLPLLLRMTILLPSKLPTDPAQRALKVKMTLYMATVALSQMNKAGHAAMRKLTRHMPNRIFQWTVQPDGPYVYLRICRGRTKAGRGIYTRCRPFVNMIFASPEAAFLIMTRQIDLLEAVKQNYLATDGSPEYIRDLSDIMKKLEDMIA
jgi:hypothetical protein